MQSSADLTWKQLSFPFSRCFFLYFSPTSKTAPSCAPLGGSQQENKSLGPPEGIRGSGYALGEPPTPGPSRAGGPSDARQCSSVKTKHSAGGNNWKYHPQVQKLNFFVKNTPKVSKRFWLEEYALTHSVCFHLSVVCFSLVFTWFFCTLEWSV